MNQSEEWRKLKDRINADPNTPRCGRCGVWLLPGSREILCRRCARSDETMLIGVLLAVAASVAFALTLYGLYWLVTRGVQ